MLREVTYDLTENHASNSVKTCQKLLENPRDDRFIHRIMTCDEKWMYFNERDKQSQWLNRRGEVAEPVTKRGLFS